jgi:hypothetical protein
MLNRRLLGAFPSASYRPLSKRKLYPPASRPLRFDFFFLCFCFYQSLAAVITLCGTPCSLPSLLCLESCRVVWASASLFTTLSFDFLRACQMVDHGLRQALEQSLSQRTILGGPLLKNHPAYRICNSSSDSRLLKTLNKLSGPKGDVLLSSRAAETMLCGQRLSESRLGSSFLRHRRY